MKKKRELKTVTLQKKVFKRFPDARAVTDEYGLWYIMDMYDEDIFEEFMIPHQSSERLAWEMGHLTARTIQNFNRSHPDKKIMDISVEAKNERFTRRKRAGSQQRFF